LQLFSIKGAKKLVQKAGMEVMNVERIINTYPIGYWLQFLGLNVNMKFGLKLDVGNFYLLSRVPH
jgi:hypothetical protein